MKRAYCQDCGKSFLREADETWKTRCIPCFKKSKRAEPAAIDSQWIDRALLAEKQVAELQRQLYTERQTIRVLIDQQSAKPINSLDRELAENWRSLVQCCHPDRHGGSPGATRLTQWLNDIKGRLPCA